MEERSSDLLNRLGLRFDVHMPVSRLSIGERQLVELARVLLEEPRLLILDEPNSALNERETQRLFDVLRQLNRRGITMLYVSHRLEEVFAICNRITVTRNGRDVSDERPGAPDHFGGHRGDDRRPTGGPVSTAAAKAKQSRAGGRHRQGTKRRRADGCRFHRSVRGSRRFCRARRLRRRDIVRNIVRDAKSARRRCDLSGLQGTAARPHRSGAPRDCARSL